MRKLITFWRREERKGPEGLPGGRGEKKEVEMGIGKREVKGRRKRRCCI